MSNKRIEFELSLNNLIGRGGGSEFNNEKVKKFSLRRKL